MAGTTATTDITAWIPSLISSQVYDTAYTGLYALSEFAEVYGDLEGQPGSQATIPTLGIVAPADDLAQTVAAADDKLTGAGVTISILEAVKSIAWYDRAQVQSKVDVNKIAGQKVGTAIADRIELDLGAAAVAGRNVAADTAVAALTAAQFRVIRNKIPASLRRRGARFFAPASVLEGLYSDAQFMDAAKSGSTQAIVEGTVARYLGVDIVEVDDSVLPVITATKTTGIMAVDGTLIRAIQRGPKVEVERDARARITRIVGTLFHGEGVVDSRGVVAGIFG
jgi:hypothetical protein